MKATERLGVAQYAREDMLSMAKDAERKGSPFAGILLRRCTPEPLL
jgi:hypothetical protein